PTNDLPENAVLIELNSPCEANIFANDGATYSLGEPDPDAEISLLDSVAGRWLESADKTVWFKFVAPYSETVTIYTNQKQLNPNEDTQVALYEVEDSSNYSIFKLLESDEDNGNNNDNLLGFNSVFSYTGLVPLQTYYIQVDGWGAKGEGTFCIRVADAAERAFVGDCLDRYAVAVDSGSVDWYNLYATPDNLDIGLLVAAINPNGNKLDSVFYQIGVAPTGDSTIYDGIPHMRTYINIQTKNTPLASTPISIRLFYSDAELAELKAISTAPNADYLDLVVSHHHGPIEDCEYINNGGPFGTLIDYFNQRYQLNGSFYLEFSTQTLGEFVARLSDIALPLELLTFHGETLDGSNRLYWTTATEQNVEWHRVERSLNGVTWSEIGKIPAQNQLGATMSYEFDDTRPPHFAYYRLRSTDFDGLASVSPAIQMVRAVDQLAVTAMYPSPTPDRLLVQFFVPREDNVELRLTDLNGRVVVQQSFEVNDGANQQELSLAHLPAGLYMITIHDSFTGTEPVRVVKQ
ncbi:MAG: T9SS type A sorting domain-containing protein, partial [Saprospiraceae bacterium]|nr:T9SS type A sorting domain-containing protein [Saprospiraceae bacterium]